MLVPEPDETSSAPSRRSPGVPSDGSLLRRIQQGNSDASTALYLRYAKRLMAVAAARTSRDMAQRIDPEDIVQSVFRTFFRRATLGQYAVPEGEELWKLLLVIALNKVRSTGRHHRAAKRELGRTAAGEAYDSVALQQPGKDDAALHFLQMVIDELMCDLPQAHRRMIELRIEGHEVNEIATAVQRSKRSVERELQEFRKRLQSLLIED
jgi:RNA polymerase sigma-70 factor, ECF subfamily